MINFLYMVILYPLEQIIEIAFNLINKLFNDNAGIAILGVSLTVTLLCLPLYIVAEGWEEKERNIQAKMKPGIDRIKQFFKKDEQYMILNTYYAQNHYHPIMALRSSFGLLIQIPFFLAAYHCLSNLPALQGQSFLFIRDMGKPDSIFTIGGFAINILPIAMTLINCISGAIYSHGHGIREKIQIYGMAMIFLVVLYTSPAGLVLYWTMNNVFSLVKNVFYKMKHPVKVLYWLMCLFVVFVAVFILFIYGGTAGMKKRIPAAFCLLLLIFVPVYLKAINWLLEKPLKFLQTNKKVRHSIFVFSAISIAILCGLLLPTQLISSSVQEFSDIESFTNPDGFLKFSLFQAIGLFLFWPCCVYFLFKEKIQSILAVLFSAGLLCAIANSFVFNGNYGSMDISLTFINGLKNPGALFLLANLLVCILIFTAVLFIVNLQKASWLSTISLLTFVSFVILSMINGSKITAQYNDYQEQKKNKTVVSGFNPQFHFTKNGKNVVLLMLDRLGSVYLEPLLNDRPSLKDGLKGFVYYPNCVSFDTHTLMGSPLVYGGYEYQPIEMNRKDNLTLKEKHNQALLLTSRIFTEQGNNFKATIADSSWGNYNYYANMDFTKQYPDINGITLYQKYSPSFKKEFASILPDASLSKIIKRDLLWVSLFRTVPAAIRPIVYYKGEWWSFFKPQDYDSFIDWYSELHYLPQITDCNAQENQYNMITNETTHAGNADISMLHLLGDQKFSSDLHDYEVSMVTLDAVEKWFEYLKENQVWNNTKIVIVADHGAYTSLKSKRGTGKTLPDGKNATGFNPVLLVKDFNSEESFRIDNKFMTNGDTPAILLKDIVDSAINPFTGLPVNITESEKAKKDGVIVSSGDMFMPYYSKSEYKFTVDDNVWYKVKDNIYNKDCWQKYYN